MTPPARMAVACLLGSPLLGLGALSSQEQPEPAAQPQYVQRLRMPTRGDSFSQPRSVAADLHAGEIFVCDTFNQRIVIFDHRGLFRYEIPGGTVFRAPVDLAIDPEGYLLVLAMNRIRQGFTLLDFDGKLIEHVTLTNLPADAVEPYFVSIALSPTGERVYLLDQDNHRLWLSDRQGRVESSVNLAEGLTEEEIQDQLLAHVDVNLETVLVSVPTDGTVYLFDLEGRAKRWVGVKGTAPCQTAFPVAAALDVDGRVVVLDKQRAMFMLWDPAGNRCLGEYFGFGNAPGAFYQPGDLALDGLGRLYVSQGFEGRIQVYEGLRPAAGAGTAAF